MDFRIVNGKSEVDSAKENTEQAEVYVLGDNAKLAILVFIMCVVPYSSYSLGAKYWGHATGTHIAVGVGAVCTILSTFLIYLSDWMENPDTPK